jgi:hypothetical protein
VAFAAIALLQGLSREGLSGLYRRRFPRPAGESLLLLQIRKVIGFMGSDASYRARAKARLV